MDRLVFSCIAILATVAILSGLGFTGVLFQLQEESIEQTKDDHGFICSNYVAQSFTPYFSRITRIYIKLGSDETSSGVWAGIYTTLDSDLLDGCLGGRSIDYLSMGSPDGGETWELAFEGSVEVTPGQTYYIGIQSGDGYMTWSRGLGDPYSGGTAYIKSGNSWYEITYNNGQKCDFCFKIYGDYGGSGGEAEFSIQGTPTVYPAPPMPPGCEPGINFVIKNTGSAEGKPWYGLWDNNNNGWEEGPLSLNYDIEPGSSVSLGMNFGPLNSDFDGELRVGHYNNGDRVQDDSWHFTYDIEEEGAAECSLFGVTPSSGQQYTQGENIRVTVTIQNTGNAWGYCGFTATDLGGKYSTWTNAVQLNAGSTKSYSKTYYNVQSNLTLNLDCWHISPSGVKTVDENHGIQYIILGGGGGGPKAEPVGTIQSPSEHPGYFTVSLIVKNSGEAGVIYCDFLDSSGTVFGSYTETLGEQETHQFYHNFGDPNNPLSNDVVFRVSLGHMENNQKVEDYSSSLYTVDYVSGGNTFTVHCVQTAGGAGVQGVVVKILKNGVLLRQQTTDVNGNAVFTLDYGDYRVIAGSKSVDVSFSASTNSVVIVIGSGGPFDPSEMIIYFLLLLIICGIGLLSYMIIKNRYGRIV